MGNYHIFVRNISIWNISEIKKNVRNVIYLKVLLNVAKIRNKFAKTKNNK